ncbi:MAG: hypothetical protein QOE54_4683 [Streptosporangiaceae bacterium]|jgi:hypothetical protein|nr:hypothetical protein [Streptosporangiaceae bacterium]
MRNGLLLAGLRFLADRRRLPVGVAHVLPGHAVTGGLAQGLGAGPVLRDPLRNLNLLGRYGFTASTPAAGALRPLRDPDASELDEDDGGASEAHEGADRLAAAAITYTGRVWTPMPPETIRLSPVM